MTTLDKMTEIAAAYLRKPSSKMVDEHIRLMAEQDLERRAKVEATKQAARDAETDKLRKMADDYTEIDQSIDACTSAIAAHRTQIAKLQAELKAAESALVSSNHEHHRLSVRQKVLVKFANDNSIVWTDEKSWTPLIEAAAQAAVSE